MRRFIVYKLLRKPFFRLYAVSEMNQWLKLNYRKHALFCMGEGLGRKERDKYRRKAKAYNKARKGMVLSFIIPPAKNQPPRNKK